MRRPDSARPSGRKASIQIAMAVLWLAAPACVAQLTTFNPSLSLGVFTTDNVQFLGSGRDADDTGYSVGIQLPVTRQLKKGTFALGLSTVARVYGDFDDADSQSHRGSMSLTTTPKRGSSIRVTASYAQTEDQGDAESEDEADLFLRQRTESEHFSFGLSYSGQLRSRWSWGFSASALIWSFDEVAGFEEDPLAAEIEDRTSFGASLQLTRALSRLASFGLSYGYSRFDLDLSGEETSQSLSLVWTREVAERLSMALALGAFESTGEAAEGPAGDPDASRTGFIGSLRLTRSWRHKALSLIASHAPGAGGARIGTAVMSQIGLTFSHRVERRWAWRFSARYANRDPSDRDEPEIDSLSIGAGIERRFRRVVGIRLDGRYVDQSSDEPTSEGSYYIGDLGLVWYPLGRSRLGGGAR